MGRCHSRDLTFELVISRQGNTVLTGALGQPKLMPRQARRIERWIELMHFRVKQPGRNGTRRGDER